MPTSCDMLLFLLGVEMFVFATCSLNSIMTTYIHVVYSVMLSLLLSGELRNLVGSILGGQTGSNISLEQVRMVGGGGGESGGGRQEEGGGDRRGGGG